jgi:hypothetical protein
VATDSVHVMTTPLTEEEVQAQAEARGYYLAAVPGSSGYSLTRPPETTPLTDVPLSLEGIVKWLSEH